MLACAESSIPRGFQGITRQTFVKMNPFDKCLIKKITRYQFRTAAATLRLTCSPDKLMYHWDAVYDSGIYFGEYDVAVVAKRLAPTKDTVFRLGAKSGNECAFPGCQARMFDNAGLMIGQICHIEAAEEGGPRFNPGQTNEQRRHVSNLMLMCYPHHVGTDDKEAFPVSRLQEMKRLHEARFESPAQDLLLMLQDWTERSAPVPPTNLRRMNRILGWGQSDAELQVSTAEVVQLVATYANVPQEVREFLMNVAARTLKMDKSGAVTWRHLSSPALLATDFEAAYRMPGTIVAEFGRRLERYWLGSVDQFTFSNYDDREEWGIQLYALSSGWPFWSDMVLFAEQGGFDLKQLIVYGDFSLLDE